MANPFEKVIPAKVNALRQLRPVLVKRMGAIGLLFIKENFEKQGFQGEVFEPWDKRKDPKDQKRPILIGKGSGRLMQSPFVSYSDSEKVIIASSLPYSRIHNEGGTISHPSRDTTLHFDHMPDKGLWRIGKTRTVKQIEKIKGSVPVTIGAHTTTMPKRQFMGPSPVINTRIKEMLFKEISATLKIIR